MREVKKVNHSLGEVITGVVTDKNDTSTYIQKDGITYEVHGDTQHALGEIVEGFAYQDQNGSNKITQVNPTATKDSFGWGTVAQTRRDLGVFVDIGLPDKDLVVSLDILPSETFLWPKKGDRLLVKIIQDKEGRLWGQLAEAEVFLNDIVPGTKEDQNKEIEGTVFQVKMVGTFFVTTDNHIGFIHPTEREREPRLGEFVSGRIIGLRDDGILYTSLLKRAHEALEEDAAMILEVLKRSPGHKMNLTDKSPPDSIKTALGISKAQFKRSIGRLMKMRLVKQDTEYTYYIGEEDEMES